MLDYAAGDSAALRQLFERYAAVLLRLIERRVGRRADAQDVLQQTFLQLHRARRDFHPQKRLRPWIMTIALNLSRDLLRRRNTRPEHILDENELPAAEPPEPVHAPSDTGERVRAALHELPMNQREVIELHWFDKLPYQEIAAIVGSTSGAVRARAHRAYITLRRSLEPGAELPDDLV